MAKGNPQGFDKKDAGRISDTVHAVEGSSKFPYVPRRRHHGLGGSGTATYFAYIIAGSGLTCIADIYNTFAADMTFTAMTPFASAVTVKVPDGCLDDTFDLTPGQVYPVAQYLVGGVKTWVITEHVGIS